jgi:hypothetical protein
MTWLGYCAGNERLQYGEGRCDRHGMVTEKHMLHTVCKEASRPRDQKDPNLDASFYRAPTVLRRSHCEHPHYRNDSTIAIYSDFIYLRPDETADRLRRLRRCMLFKTSPRQQGRVCFVHTIYFVSCLYCLLFGTSATSFTIWRTAYE